MITMRELAGLGELPTQEELKQYAALRPALSSSEVAQAKNDYLAAQRGLKSANEKNRRCMTYVRTGRSPADFGYSSDCQQEKAARGGATTLVTSTRKRHEELKLQAAAQMHESYATDSRPIERSRPIRYVKGRSGAYVPVRDPSAFLRASEGPSPELPQQQAPLTPQPRPRSRLPLVIAALVVGGATLFYLSR